MTWPVVLAKHERSARAAFSLGLVERSRLGPDGAAAIDRGRIRAMKVAENIILMSFKYG